jgi:hypothetical protein
MGSLETHMICWLNVLLFMHQSSKDYFEQPRTLNNID